MGEEDGLEGSEEREREKEREEIRTLTNNQGCALSFAKRCNTKSLTSYYRHVDQPILCYSRCREDEKGGVFFYLYLNRSTPLKPSRIE